LDGLAGTLAGCTHGIESSFTTAGRLPQIVTDMCFDAPAYLTKLPTQRTLRFDKSSLIHTDGSKADTSLGTGIYDGPRNRLVAVMPTGHTGQLNTVPKAEGTAILAALQAAPPGEDVTILTDSLTLIHVIHSPTRYRVHKQKHLLKKVVNIMLSRPGRTTMYKVRAHVGVAGNELSDQQNWRRRHNLRRTRERQRLPSEMLLMQHNTSLRPRPRPQPP